MSSEIRSRSWTDSNGRDAVDDPLHEREHKDLLAALIAIEDLGREAAVPRLGDLSGHGADPGVEGPEADAVTVALPFGAPFVRARPERLGHRRRQDRVQDRLHPPGQTLRFVQKSGQQILGYADIVLGYRFDLRLDIAHCRLGRSGGTHHLNPSAIGSSLRTQSVRMSVYVRGLAAAVAVHRFR